LKNVISALGMILVILAAPLSLSAEDELVAAEQLTLQEQMARLTSAVGRLNELMETSLEHQQTLIERQALEIALARIGLAQERISPLEEELSRLRAEQDRAKEQRARMLEELNNLDEMERNEEDGGESSGIPFDQIRKQVRSEVQRLDEILWNLDQRIMEMENELSRRQEEVIGLEENVDIWLGIR